MKPTYTEPQIKSLIEAGLATSSICTETGKPIFLNDHYYLLAGDRYANDCDIDKIITEVTNGEFTNSDALYISCNPQEFRMTGSGDPDYFYNSSLEDAGEIFEEIWAEESFYNASGEIISFTKSADDDSEIDLFEHYFLQPKELRELLESYSDKWDNGIEYTELAELLKQCNALGYTFDYGLDAEPLELQKIKKETNN